MALVAGLAFFVYRGARGIVEEHCRLVCRTVGSCALCAIASRPAFHPVVSLPRPDPSPLLPPAPALLFPHGSIEYHHIHHLSPLVPMYRLPACHKAGAALFANVPRVTLLDGLRWLTPMVWDHKVNKFVGV